MPTLVKYLVATGAIVGVWTSNNETLLAAQADQVESGYSTLPGPEDIPVSTLEEGYVVIDGAVVPQP